MSDHGIKLGDVATCLVCGAKSAPAYVAVPSRYRPGRDPLLVRWEHGERLRVETAFVAPAICVWCDDKARASPLPKPKGQLGLL